MKNFNPEAPKDVLARHKLVAFTTLMSIREFLGEDKVEDAEVVVHTSEKTAHSMVKELSSLGLKVVAYCNGKRCHWNAKGVDFSPERDRELEIDPIDTYFLESDVIILDEASDYIDLEDSKNFNSSILIETGNFITRKAKEALKKRNIEVIPHQFFELYPLDAAKTQNLNKTAQSIREVWEEVANYAKKKNTNFDTAFEYVKSQDVV